MTMMLAVVFAVMARTVVRAGVMRMVRGVVRCAVGDALVRQCHPVVDRASVAIVARGLEPLVERLSATPAAGDQPDFSRADGLGR